MAETDNISRMAQKISDDIFGVFGWTRLPALNQNWACVTGKHEKRTHPSDVVFWYDDPYRAERIYLNVDLKSYAATSISKASIAGAIGSLAKAIECANVSETWQNIYHDGEATYRCDGLLFIYNHDGNFDRDFVKLLEIDEANFKLAKRRRMAIFGPLQICYLHSVANDILGLRGKGVLPLDASAVDFWYPDLVRLKRREQAHSAASVEMLTGPWITLRVPRAATARQPDFVVWYRDSGETVEEFKYLLDSFFRYQMLTVERDTSISIRLVDPASIALPNFRKAIVQLSSTLYGLASERLERVTCESITSVVRRFSEVEIGMDAR